MDFTEGDEAAHEEAGTDEQGERDGYFENDDGIAQATMSCAAAGAFAAVAERIVEIAANDLEGGGETKDDGGEHGGAKGEGKHGKIEADDGFGGDDPRRYEGNEAFEATPSEEGAEDCAANGEQKTFDEELTNDAPASGSEGGADGEFFFAGGGAGEEQVGDVAATDEEQEAYGGEDDVQGGAELADDEIGERFDVNAEFLRVVLGIHSGKILGDDSEVGFGLADGDARLEMTEQEPELRESIL